MRRPSIWEQKQAKFPNIYDKGWKERLLFWGKNTGPSPITTQHAGASGTCYDACPHHLAVTQNLPKILLKQLIFGKGIAKSTTFWVIYILFLYKVKSPQSNLPGPYQLSCPQKPFMSWDPLLHPPLLLSIYRKHHLLKNISTISTKQQLKAFSIMILNICYIKFLLEGTAPKTLKPMDEIVLLTLSDNISYPTQFPSVPWFPGSSVLNLVLNCSHSHIVQHTHISFHL